MEKELIQLELPFDAVIDYQEAEQENYKVLENIHLQAIINSQEFLDLFEDVTCVKNFYANNNVIENEQEDKSIYYIFKAHDAITGRNIAIKVTNPLQTECSERLKWESKILETLKNKNNCQKIVKSFTESQIKLKYDNEVFNNKVSFIASEYLPINIKKITIVFSNR